MIDVEPPVAGWDEFIGPYVLGARQVALVDVGPSSSAGNLIDGLKALYIKPKSVSHILLTHVHLDHAGAIGELLEFLPQANVVVHPKGAPHLADTDKLWEGSAKTLGDLAEKYGRPQNVAPERIVPVEDGMRIGLGDGLDLEVMYTPGHAVHHLSFFERGSGMLFAGEAGGVYTSRDDLLRPATPSPFILEQKLASIDKLVERKPTTICYGHFGPGKDARHNLLRYREQLELWREVVSEILASGAGSEAIFSELMERDANLESMKDLPEDQYQRECYFMINNIRGFVGYVEKRNRKREYPHHGDSGS